MKGAGDRLRHLQAFGCHNAASLDAMNRTKDFL